jgi:benzoate membrane transport protein
MSKSMTLPPVSAWSSALIATLVGFGGTVALIIQAVRVLGADVTETTSAVTALCIGMGIGGVVLSVWSRMPIVLAWSTPGAALLATSASGATWAEAIGAFLLAALLMILVGVIPVFGALARRVPSSVASAMLAGVLLPFCLHLFKLGNTDPLLVVTLVTVFVVARQKVPLYALLLVLTAGVTLTLLRGAVTALPDGATLGTLSPTAPTFRFRTLLSLGVPLFLVTLVSQNLPGLVVLSSAGYHPKPGPLLWSTGLLTLLLAPFGALAVNLSAITAALCTSEEAHPDATRRWTVGVIYAGCYLLLAVFSPLLVRLFLAMPSSVIAALTGVALIPALTGAVESMLTLKPQRDAAMVTFLATGSGVSAFGLGSAFWGLLAGFLALGASKAWRRTRA